MENSDHDTLLDAVETQSLVDTEPIRTAETNVPCNAIDENHRRRHSYFSGPKWKMLGAIVHNSVQVMVGACVGLTLWFAFKSTTLGAFELHVGLSVIGYQLLMAHGFLCLRSDGWAAFSFRNRRRGHWILQVAGSILAIAGSAIMIRSKQAAGRNHFTSSHAKLALAAMIFTCASLINGMSSLFSVELRRFIPPKLSKISHLILGVAAFATSSASLAYGYLKKSFIEWSSEEFSYIMVTLVSIYTVAIIIAPCCKITRKLIINKIC